MSLTDVVKCPPEVILRVTTEIYPSYEADFCGIFLSEFGNNIADIVMHVLSCFLSNVLDLKAPGWR